MLICWYYGEQRLRDRGVFGLLEGSPEDWEGHCLVHTHCLSMDSGESISDFPGIRILQWNP